MNSFNSSTLATTRPTNVDSCTNIKFIISLLNSTIPLLWIIVGTITNGLSLIVFSRKSMKRNSTFFYLAIMTLSDFIVIWICSLRDFLAYKYHIFISGVLLCKLHVFTFFVSCQFSSWLLTAANFDRLIYVISYQNSKAWCTRKTAVIVTCILFMLLVLLNGHFLMFVGSETNAIGVNGTSLSTINPFVYPLCTLSPGGYDTFYNKYYSWIDAFVFSFVPFIIMSICNAVLIFKVFSTKRNIKNRNAKLANNKRDKFASKQNDDNESQAASRKVSFVPTLAESASVSQLNQHQQHTINSNRPSYFAKETSPFLTVHDRSISNNCISSQKLQLTNSGSYNDNFPDTNLSSLNTSANTFQQQTISKQQASESSDRMRNLAITIIGVTLLFILFTVPINIYVPIVASSSHDNSDEKKCDDLIFCILNNMVNANHSINFFIYFLTNSKFKREILSIFQTLKVCFTQSNLGIFLSVISCGRIDREKFDNSNARHNAIRMKEKKHHDDRAISGTSFAAEATFAQSRNNSHSQLDSLLQNGNNANSKSQQLTNNNNITKSNSSYLSSSFTERISHVRNNSSPASGSTKLSPASSTSKLHNGKCNSHQHSKLPEINLIEVSESSTVEASVNNISSDNTKSSNITTKILLNSTKENIIQEASTTNKNEKIDSSSTTE